MFKKYPAKYYLGPSCIIQGPTTQISCEHLKNNEEKMQFLKNGRKGLMYPSPIHFLASFAYNCRRGIHDRGSMIGEESVNHIAPPFKEIWPDIFLKVGVSNI